MRINSNRLRRIESKLQPQNTDCLVRMIFEDSTTGKQRVSECKHKATSNIKPGINTFLFRMADVVSEEEWHARVEALRQ